MTASQSTTAATGAPPADKNDMKTSGAASAASKKTATFQQIEAAIRSTNPIEQLSVFFQQSSPQLIDPATDRNVLHAAAEFADLKTFQWIFDRLSAQNKILMARSAQSNRRNDEGEEFLPIDALYENPVDIEQKKQMILMLEKLELTDFPRGLYDLIDEKEISTRYPTLDKKSEQYENLFAAVQIINLVRKLKLNSISHPEGANKINNLIELQQLRQQKEDWINSFRPLLDNDADSNAELIFQRMIAMTKGGKPFIADCYEYAIAGKQLSATLSNGANIFKKTKTHQLFGGNHCFLMIGDVYCDPWRGEFCLASEIPIYLKGARSYWSPTSERMITVSIPLNQKLHRVIPDNLNLQPQFQTEPQWDPGFFSGSAAITATTNAQAGADIGAQKPTPFLTVS